MNKCTHHWPKMGDWNDLGWGVLARNVKCDNCAAVKTENRVVYIQDGEEHVWSENAQVRDD